MTVSTSENGGQDRVFADTVKNLLKMKPKPHKEDSGSPESQSEDDQSSSKRDTKSRNSGDD